MAARAQCRPARLPGLRRSAVEPALRVGPHRRRTRVRSRAGDHASRRTPAVIARDRGDGESRRVGADGTLHGKKPVQLYPDKSGRQQTIVDPALGCTNDGRCLVAWAEFDGEVAPDLHYVDKGYGVLLDKGVPRSQVSRAFSTRCTGCGRLRPTARISSSPGVRAHRARRPGSSSTSRSRAASPRPVCRSGEQAALPRARWDGQGDGRDGRCGRSRHRRRAEVSGGGAPSGASSA